MGTEFCSKCCEDLDLPLQHLFFPELYLDKAGQEFLKVHGFDLLRKQNARLKFKLGDIIYEIGFMELIFPHRYLKGKDLAFYYEHGLDKAVQTNATIKLYHVCDQLLPNGRCSIYETRPKVCRDFDCRIRVPIDCENQELIQIVRREEVAHA